MAARRKAPRRRARRSFNVNLLETGAGLAFLDAADAGPAAQSFLKGDLKGGLDTLLAPVCHFISIPLEGRSTQTTAR